MSPETRALPASDVSYIKAEPSPFPSLPEVLNGLKYGAELADSYHGRSAQGNARPLPE